MRTGINVGMNLAAVGNHEGRQFASLANNAEANRFAAFRQLVAPAHAPDLNYAWVRIHADNCSTLSRTANAGNPTNASRRCAP